MIKKCFFILIIILLTGGCYRFSYKTGLPPSGNKVTEWRHILVWGISTPEIVDLDKMSPQGVAEFGSYTSFPNWLCAFFTIGFYSPQTVYVIPAAKQENTGMKNEQSNK